MLVSPLRQIGKREIKNLRFVTYFSKCQASSPSSDERAPHGWYLEGE